MSLKKLRSIGVRPVALAAATMALAAFLAAPASAGSDDDLMYVYLNHARVLKLDRPISKVIVGSAEVADATVADARTVVLTGRKIGTTNLVILDAQDNPILDQRILVSTDEGKTLRVFRSTSRDILTCTPNCEKHEN